MRTTYKKEDVELLLKDITGLVKPQSTQEREQLIQQGWHYCEMLPIEYSRVRRRIWRPTNYLEGVCRLHV